MMARLVKLVFIIAYILFNQSVIQGTIFSCDTFAPCGCSRNKVDINSRIIGGEPAANHSWGWAVSLRVVDELHFCGGTILSSHYVLTAAHCVDDPEIMDYELKVAVGTNTLTDNDGQRVPVSEIFLHPDWTSRTNENDIAILKLEYPMDFNDDNIAKICLPSVDESIATNFPIIDSSLVAIGWGYTVFGGVESDVLRQVTVEAIGNNEEKCNNSINNVTVQFCAAVDDGEKDTCEGDSGGPLMYYSKETQQWMIVGITSYGRGCGVSIYAGIYTRISMYIDWIKSITGTDGIIVVEQSTTTLPETSTNTMKENSANFVTVSNLIVINSLLFLMFLHL